MEVYKGMDRNMRCLDMQYGLDETKKTDDAIRCGNKGFHSCEAPLDVLKYYRPQDGNRYFVAEAGGEIDRTGAYDSKIASSELTLKAEVKLIDLVRAQIEYTRKKAEPSTSGGNWSNLVGGSKSNLAGGNLSNLASGSRSNLVGGSESSLAGGNESNLVGGYKSNLASGYKSNLAGGNWSNLAGGIRSNLIGGDKSNLVGGNWSNLVSGAKSNLVGGNESNLAGGNESLIVGRNSTKAKGGIRSVIILTEWARVGDEYTPVAVKAEIVDGERIKADTWYALKDGEFVEVER